MVGFVLLWPGLVGLRDSRASPGTGNRYSPRSALGPAAIASLLDAVSPGGPMGPPLPDALAAVPRWL